MLLNGNHLQGPMKNDEVFSFNDMKFYSKIVVAFIDKK